MDNFKLSKLELQQLILFIRKRGFKEPLLVAEILDHFACKVEERMILNPGMSLQEAMARAHNEFGALGFQPLVKTFEGAARKKYRTLFQSNLKMVLAQPKHVAFAALLALGLYCLCYWAGKTHIEYLWGLTTEMPLVLIFLTSTVVLAVKYRLFRRSNPFTHVVFQAGSWGGVFEFFNF